MIMILSAKKNLDRLINVEIVCPKCGKAGVLRSSKKNTFGKRKYTILHDGYKCYISWLDENWEELDEFYKKIRGLKMAKK